MSKRVEIGRRSNGTFGACISAPGNEVTSSAARLLFSSDVGFASVLFEGVVAMDKRKRTVVTSSPFGTIVDYYFQGYGKFIFPRTLDFKPSAHFLIFETKDSTPTYTLAHAADGYEGNRLSYISATNQIELIYYYPVSADTSVDSLSVYVSVLSIPWDT